MTPALADFTLLQVTPELETGGAEQTTLDIARAVSAAGGRALVASRGGRMAPVLETYGGRLIIMPVQSKNPLIIIANALRLANVIRREKVDLIHARSRAPAFSALLAARLTGRPFVATYHGVYKARGRLKRWYNAVMTRGEFVIANSEYTRDHVLAEHALDPARVITIPRGVDLTSFDPATVAAGRVEALRTAWSLIPDDPRTVFLLAGRLTRIKGHLTVVAAAKLLKAAGRQDFLILFAGDDQGRTGYRLEVERAISEAGLTGFVRVVGHCSDMPAAYLLADMAILPSIVPESFGRTAVEPQAMGLPVLVSDHGGPRETVVEGETGWRVTPGEPQAWAEAFARAIDAGREKRHAMGAAAAQRARALYSVRAMCDATLAVYARVMDAQATGAGR